MGGLAAKFGEVRHFDLWVVEYFWRGQVALFDDVSVYDMPKTAQFSGRSRAKKNDNRSWGCVIRAISQLDS